MTVYKGWNAKIYMKKDGSYVEVACCESVSVDVDVGLEPYYCIGSKEPFDLTEGPKEITGSISKAWVNKEYLSMLIGQTLTEFNLAVGVGNMTLYCYNCKFESGSIDIPVDGVLKEDYDFRATSIALV